MRHLRYVCLLAGLLGPVMAIEQEGANLASFEQVWSAVRERHWQKERIGRAWDQALDELRRDPERTRSAAEVRPVIARLLAKFGQSHFEIIPLEAYENLEDGRLSSIAQPGFDFRLIDGEVVVTHGDGLVHPGWTLLKIGQEDVGRLLEKVKAVVSGEREAQLFAHSLLRHRLSGRAGDRIDVTFGLPGGKSRATTIQLMENGHLVKFGNLPPIVMQIASRRLTVEIGYFRFNVFFDPEWLQAELGRTVRECSDCRGFILDLLENLGGMVALTSAVAAWFLPDRRAWAR